MVEVTKQELKIKREGLFVIIDEHVQRKLTASEAMNSVEGYDQQISQAELQKKQIDEQTETILEHRKKMKKALGDLGDQLKVQVKAFVKKQRDEGTWTNVKKKYKDINDVEIKAVAAHEIMMSAREEYHLDPASPIMVEMRKELDK